MTIRFQRGVISDKVLSIIAIFAVVAVAWFTTSSASPRWSWS